MLLALATVACVVEIGNQGADPARLDPIEIDIERIRPRLRGLGTPVPVGDVLVASRAHAMQSDGVDLVASTDRGATWQTVDLPGRTETVDGFAFLRAGDRLVVAADLPTGFSPERMESERAVYLWVSDDGHQWRGGRVAVPRPTDDIYRVRTVWEDGGGTLVAVIGPLTEHDAEQVLQSHDGGATWVPGECPAGHTTDRGCRQEGGVRHVGDLAIRQGDDGVEISTDGSTWEPVDLPGVNSLVVDFEAVELRGGGWLVVADTAEDDGSDSWEQSHLLRLDDDLRWQRVLGGGSGCERGFPGEWISPPVALGDGWLVAYGCDNPADGSGPLLSQLYHLDAGGGNPSAVAGTEQSDAAYGTPITVGDDVLVPSHEFTTGATTLILRLRP